MCTHPLCKNFNEDDRFTVQDSGLCSLCSRIHLLTAERDKLRELARAPIREWLDRNPNEQIKALWEENKRLDEENEKFRARLQIDPGGSDKIDELEEAMNHLRFQYEELKKKVGT
jgi:hypothetical protein